MGAAVLRVGLTGNIAAGKSTVASWLAELGCIVLNLDAMGHDCLRAGTPTHRRVVSAFGASILTADGGIDRAALGGFVFGDEGARRRLEAILHPAIRAAEERRVQEISAARGESIVVSEAALLYETGGHERYDRMVVVTASETARRTRLEGRGLDADGIGARMAAQMDQARKAELADYVVDNDGPLERTHAITRRLAALLRRDLMRRITGEPLAAPSPLA